MRSSQIMEVQGLNRRREPMRGASEADRINDAEDQQQRTSSALVQLALVAPPEVGRMQRRTAGWLLRYGNVSPGILVATCVLLFR